MRSMARWVLPVFVGPRTAVTPRARTWEGRESEAMLTFDDGGTRQTCPGGTGV